MKKAWYLGYGANDVGESAILAGDPARVDRIAELLSEPCYLPVSRGLKSVTGNYFGRSITAVAFGMGAPIATIVMHELSDLGVCSFMRVGTAMYFAPASEGDLVLCETAISYEGTSTAYVESTENSKASEQLNAQVCRLSADRARIHPGSFATFDAFYRDMFPLDEKTADRVRDNMRRLETMRVIAADMETSALVNAAHYLGVDFASLCVATVDAKSRRKIDQVKLGECERQMFEVALGALASLNGSAGTGDNE